jgi:subtilase family serine protease
MAQKKSTKKIAEVKPRDLARIKLPDLTITNIRVIKLNKECKVAITIKNIGTAGVPDEKYGMVGDDSKASSVRVEIGSIPSVGRYLRMVDPDGKLKTPGGEVKHIWFETDSFSTVPPGLHSITAIADDNSKISELNESNNRLTKRLICPTPKGPDLIVKSVYIKPGNPGTNDLIHFFAQIQNTGNLAAPVSKASFRIGGETNGKIFPIPVLNPGQSFQISRKMRLSVAQNYLATVIADVNNVVAEIDENNNKKKFPFTVN